MKEVKPEKESGEMQKTAGDCVGRFDINSDECTKCGLPRLAHVDYNETEHRPSGSESSGSSDDERLYDQFTEQAMKQREAVCTCFAKPDQEHSTYCPREGMDFDAEESHGS